MSRDSTRAALCQAWTRQLYEDGYAMLIGLVTDATVDRLGQQITEVLAESGNASVLRSQGHAYGSRNLLEVCPAVMDLLRDATLQEWVRSVMGGKGGVVRVLYFDKPPERSWSLPWHRDLTIAVQRHDLPSEVFGKRTMKGGVPHVEAPPQLLERMLTLRVHLDPMVATNGPLAVIPGSHRLAESTCRDAVELNSPAGGILAMRPLLSHSSRQGEPGNVLHRRVVHFELAPSSDLPDGYAWHQFCPLPPGVEVQAGKAGAIRS